MLMMAGNENCKTSFGILAVPKELRRSEFKLDISAPNVVKGECCANTCIGIAEPYYMRSRKDRIFFYNLKGYLIPTAFFGNIKQSVTFGD